MMLRWEEFERVDMRIGTVISAEVYSEARNPAYLLLIDFGPTIGQLKSSAQITTFYNPNDLLGKQIVAVVNFPKKQIGKIRSECLVLGAVEDQGVTLLMPNRSVANGTRIG